MSRLEGAAAALSLLGIYLGTRRRPASWPVSLLACLLYGRLFLSARLYSDSLLQGLFCLFILYGWINWRRQLDDQARVRPAPLSRTQRRRDLTLGALGALLLGALMDHSQAALPWLDAALTAASLVAQFWQARRHTAAWPLWMAVDTLYIGEYAYQALWLTAVLYGVLVLLAGQGWRHWRASEQALSTPPGAQPP